MCRTHHEMRPVYILCSSHCGINVTFYLHSRFLSISGDDCKRKLLHVRLHRLIIEHAPDKTLYTNKMFTLLAGSEDN
jgi:hypothetical protein